MKIKILGKAVLVEGDYCFDFILDPGPEARSVHVPLGLSPEQIAAQWQEPVQVDPWWIYLETVVQTEMVTPSDQPELLLRIKHAVLRKEKALAKIQREIEAFDRHESLDAARREHISEAVRLFVWQRDEGRCVKCGSREKLEYDHIIPVADGGSSTERNIQLLCESCNRSKGRNLA